MPSIYVECKEDKRYSLTKMCGVCSKIGHAANGARIYPHLDRPGSGALSEPSLAKYQAFRFTWP